ncbi:MAG: hypothetical protein R3C26_16850 [Calditrichia bacterium]
MFFPAAVAFWGKLGIPGIPAIDVRNACSGFVYSVTIANSFIKSGLQKYFGCWGRGVSHCLDKLHMAEIPPLFLRTAQALQFSLQLMIPKKVC